MRFLWLLAGIAAVSASAEGERHQGGSSAVFGLAQERLTKEDVHRNLLPYQVTYQEMAAELQKLFTKSTCPGLYGNSTYKSTVNANTLLSIVTECSNLKIITYGTGNPLASNPETLEGFDLDRMEICDPAGCLTVLYIGNFPQLATPFSCTANTTDTAGAVVGCFSCAICDTNTLNVTIDCSNVTSPSNFSTNGCAEVFGTYLFSPRSAALGWTVGSAIVGAVTLGWAFLL